jgi:TFIIF-interacting CTD phosphatase-like protein
MIEAEFKQLREQVTIPYLPGVTILPKFCESIDKVYTLVLDLDETLIHFELDEDGDAEEEPGYYLIRPGAMNFLTELSQYYEIVIFTAAMPDVSISLLLTLTLIFEILVC